MTVLHSATDPETLTFTITSELRATPARIWQLWSDPRQLERWWGPPEWPATFVDLDFVPGGEARYYMTGPVGEKAHGWWTFITIDPHRTIVFDDGFADDTGEPDRQMPTLRGRMELQPDGDVTRMVITTRFASAEQLEQVVGMGMVEGMTGALGQIDAVLAAQP